MFDKRTIADFENKFTMMVFRQDAKLQYSQLSNKATSIYYLEENLLTVHFSLLIDRWNPLKRIIHQKIDQLIETGWIQKIKENRMYDAARNVKNEEEQGPMVLTMDHLEICFVAVLVCLAFCCFVFIIERIAFSFSNAN
jgi:hypothetical protein